MGTQSIMGKITPWAMSLALLGGLASLFHDEASYLRQYLQVNESGQNPPCTRGVLSQAVDRSKPVEPLYRVFRKDDNIAFRRVGSNCAYSPSILAPTYKGSLNQGINDCITQPAPVRGIGWFSFCRGHPLFERYEKQFDLLVLEYKIQFPNMVE